MLFGSIWQRRAPSPSPRDCSPHAHGWYCHLIPVLQVIKRVIERVTVIILVILHVFALYLRRRFWVASPPCLSSQQLLTGDLIPCKPFLSGPGTWDMDATSKRKHTIRSYLFWGPPQGLQIHALGISTGAMKPCCYGRVYCWGDGCALAGAPRPKPGHDARWRSRRKLAGM